MNIADAKCKLVDERDGTIIEDDDVLAEMAGCVLMLLTGDERWTQTSAQDVQQLAKPSPQTASITAKCTPKRDALYTDQLQIQEGCAKAKNVWTKLEQKSLSENSPVIDLTCNDRPKPKPKPRCSPTSAVPDSNQMVKPVQLTAQTPRRFSSTGEQAEFSNSQIAKVRPTRNEKETLTVDCFQPHMPSAPHRDNSSQAVSHEGKVDSFELEHNANIVRGETSQVRPRNDSAYKSADDGNNELLNIIFGNLPSKITQWEYYRICSIVKTPVLQAADTTGFVGNVLPYIIQRVKMRGCNALHATHIAGLVQQHSNNLGLSPEAPVSRLDCLTGMFNSVDEIVACDLLTIMSQFPLALPLVLRSVMDERYTILTPLLRGIVLKWENSTGKIIEHSLFNNSYRLIVAVRLGDNMVGKSTILNQMLVSENTFSSGAEPGGEYGKPAALNGSTEFVWLTQETCKCATWNVLQQFYSSEMNEVCLLANLHGDGSDFVWLIKLLRQHFSCHFLLFVMPNCSTEKMNNFIENVVPERQVTVIRVDPRNTAGKFGGPDEILTGSLTVDTTLRKVRESIRRALESCKSQATVNDGFRFEISQLSVAAAIRTSTSQTLVDFVKTHGCSVVKAAMELQVKRPNEENVKLILRRNEMLRKIIDILIQTFMLPANDLHRAVIHIEKELSRLSNADSQSARADLHRQKKDLQQALMKQTSNKNDIKRLQSMISKALTELDKNNLGLEHFIREIAQYYEFNLRTKEGSDVTRIPEHIVHLFIAGQPLELFDGDAGDIAMNWFNAVCKRVTVMYPKLRIYVVSIIGLQSSGKSTLLNSLFACRFAVSVGRCSRGLFMRLLFLEDKLVESLKCDAILLIDTEGLGSPEKMNVTEAEKKDRLLAAFAMGISNLTIINVLGEYIKELTEILQIAIVTMARLEQAEISPDILMVQHLLTEKNSDRTLESQEQFCQAIHTAVQLAEKEEVNVGIRNAKCLSVLFKRVQDGTLLSQFHPYKDGATANSPPSKAYHEDVVQLYEKILESCRSSVTIIDFKKWQTMVESYWNCVTQEDFALRFKNVKEIYEFIERGKRIEAVKQAIKTACTSHSNLVRAKIRYRTKEMDSKSLMNTKDDILQIIEKKLGGVPRNCFEKCGACAEAVQHMKSLFDDIEGQAWEQSVKMTINEFEIRLRQSMTRKLIQIYDSSIIQHGCSMDFDKIITDRLNCELKQRKPEELLRNDDLRQQITHKIMGYLRSFVVQQQDHSQTVRDKIVSEIGRVYPAVTDMNDQFEQQEVFENVFDIRDKNKIYAACNNVKQMIFQNFDRDQYRIEIGNLKTDLSELPNKIVAESKADCYEEGMVAQMKSGVDLRLEQFCCRNPYPKLAKDAKIRLHVWTQQLFCSRMEDLQREWDKKHKPAAILEQNEERYRQIIDTRLKYGFTCASEAEIIAQFLTKEIGLKAVVAENSARVHSVFGLTWTTNSECVRLKYFKELAEEVRKNNKARALRHFTWPKEEIEQWYTEQVNSFSKNNYGKTFEKTILAEKLHVCNTISRATNIQEVISFVQKYVVSNEGTYYTPSIDMTDMIEDQFDSMKLTILDSLKDTTILPEQFSFSLPSSDPDVMGRLGCTHRCWWCGALCWGQRGHEQNADETKKHHASHQPKGLIKVRIIRSHTLVPYPCHDLDDERRVYFGEYADENGPGLSWKLAKENHFSDWKFDRHYISKYDELMRWFFQELNKDIAKSSEKYHPASKEDLEKHGCCNLNITDILTRIEQEIK